MARWVVVIAVEPFLQGAGADLVDAGAHNELVLPLTLPGIRWLQQNVFGSGTSVSNMKSPNSSARSRRSVKEVMLLSSKIRWLPPARRIVPHRPHYSTASLMDVWAASNICNSLSLPKRMTKSYTGGSISDSSGEIQMLGTESTNVALT